MYATLIRFLFTSNLYLIFICIRICFYPRLLIRISTGVQRLRNSAYGHELCGLMEKVGNYFFPIGHDGGSWPAGQRSGPADPDAARLWQ